MARLFWTLIFVLTAFAVQASKPDVVRIYLDADRTGHLESALSIEHGIKVAFSQHGDQIAGVPVEFVTTDHRGNVLRSKKEYAALSRR